MANDIRIFKTFEEAATSHLGDVQLAVSQTTGDYLDMYEAVYVLKDDAGEITGYQKVIAMYEPGTSVIRSIIFENGYGRHFVKDSERQEIEVKKIKRFYHKME